MKAAFLYRFVIAPAFNAKALKSLFRRNYGASVGVGVGVIGCERKIGVVRERKFVVDANR